VNTVSVCFSSINQRLQLVKKFINDNFPTSLARVVVPSVDYRGCDFRVRMDRGAGPRHDRVEPAVSVVLVLHLSDGTVRLHQSVLPFDDVSVALFRLFFDVSGVIVFHSVLEAVLGIGLEPNKVIPFAPLPLDRSHHGLHFGQSLRSVLHRVGRRRRRRQHHQTSLQHLRKITKERHSRPLPCSFCYRALLTREKI
jgi:hypothetical protein